jgi:hypothetical protein
MKKDSDILLINAGTRDIKNERATAGSRPLSKPRIGLGRSSIQPKKDTLEDREWMLETIPTKPHGIDQKRTITAIKA